MGRDITFETVHDLCIIRNVVLILSTSNRILIKVGMVSLLQKAEITCSDELDINC